MSKFFREEVLSSQINRSNPLISHFSAISSFGLSDVTPIQSNAILLDLLPHPKQSHPRNPLNENNILWAKSVRDSWEANIKSLHPELSGARAAPGSPYPPFCLSFRLKALSDLGADMPSALLRCCFRRDFDATRFLLTIPSIVQNPNPKSTKGTSILQRLAYQGPDDLFSLVLEANRNAGYFDLPVATEDDLPESWAMRCNAQGRLRMLLQARFTEDPLTLFGPLWGHPSTLKAIMALAQNKTFNHEIALAAKRQSLRSI